MNTYMFATAAMVAAYYTYTYGVWLKKNGYKTGSRAVYLFILLDLAIAAYHVFGK